MKAWVLHGANDLRREEVERPVLEAGEVRILVKAAGICGSDIPRIYQTGAHTHPLIPGHEFSGMVEALGSGVDPVWLGRRVGVFPLIPCGQCMPCQKQQYEMCRHYSYLGSRRNSGFGEYAAVPVWNLLLLPDCVKFEEAAMLEPMAVAVHAMRRAVPSPSDTVVVCGLGPIGLLLVMFLKEAGVSEILAIGNKDTQRQMYERLGLPQDTYCDSRLTDVSGWLWERTKGHGADVFFECVGRKETYEMAVTHAAPSGRVMLVGNPHSDMSLSKEIYWKILRNQLTVSGTWNSSFLHDPGDDWHYVLKRMEEKRIAPSDLITHRFCPEDLEKGLQIMKNKTEDYGKIMSVDGTGLKKD